MMLLGAAAVPAGAAPVGKTAAAAISPAAAKASAAARAPTASPAAGRRPIGAVTLPPLSYTILKSGPADGAHPKRSDVITVNYTLTLLDGTVVDTTEGKAPATFPLNRLIPAWQILIQLMRPGDVWTFYVPPEYAYGSIAKERLPADSFLTFRVELLSGGEPPEAIPQPQ